MLHYAIVFLVIALIAAVLGFSGNAASAAGIAKIVFVVLLILAVASFIFGRGRRWGRRLLPAFTQVVSKAVRPGESRQRAAAVHFDASWRCKAQRDRGSCAGTAWRDWMRQHRPIVRVPLHRSRCAEGTCLAA